MARWQRAALMTSLALNLLFVIAGVWYHDHVSRSAKALLLMNLRAAVQANEAVLQELESNDPDRVRDVADALRRRIADGREQVEQWRKAVE